jgi:ATP-dependent Lon protease
VAIKGKHKFIDKIHVRYVEKEKRHWASLENFASQRIAIGEKYYRDNDRLLEGGIWAEAVIAHSDMDADNYAFYVEDLRPIQLSRLDFGTYVEARAAFSRDEWMDAVLRSVGLEPSKLTKRLKFHFMARLAPLVEANFNFIELGPRGTGKSYFFSESSPYSTLISGGQATKSILFYNNARQKIGLVGFWDTVAFDEVSGIKVKDPDTIQIMKDFMANGRFSRGVEVIADASMAFVGNIDQSVEQIVNSTEYDLFLPLPPQFDLALMDRFACYLPGWEMPKNSDTYLTGRYGLITDYLAEAFHYQLKHSNRYEEVSKRLRLGRAVEGRDEKGIKKTLCAFLKILHPADQPTDGEFEEYVAYALECRRRIKEQMNKRKPDDEFVRIDLSYIDANDKEIVVYCPESRNAPATLVPARRRLETLANEESAPRVRHPGPAATPAISIPAPEEIKPPAAPSPLTEQHFSIQYGDTGYSYDTIFGSYLAGAKAVTIEDPYIRAPHQIANFVRFCETVVRANPTVGRINLITGYDDKTDLAMVRDKLEELKQSLLEADVLLDIKLSEKIHDREVRIDNGWTVKIGRGLDFYQKPDGWFSIGVSDLGLRKCLETKVDIFKQS